MNKPLPAKLLKERGFCCGNGCLNCPYRNRHAKHAQILDQHFLAFQSAHPDATYADYLKKPR